MKAKWLLHETYVNNSVNSDNLRTTSVRHVKPDLGIVINIPAKSVLNITSKSTIQDMGKALISDSNLSAKIIQSADREEGR
jgi:hypothetical protein